MNAPLVSIIIVTYNSKDYIKRCLDSILRITYKPVEIVIVDNHSSDSTQQILEKYKGKVKTVFSDINLGYAAGNNLGIDQSKGEYVFLLNPDTLVDKEFLTPLVSAMDKDTKVAAAQPAVYLLKEPTRLNLTGKKTHFLGFDWVKDYNSITLPEAGYIASFSGCGILLEKETLQKTGSFDPEYFMYYEDSDLSWRFKLFGYRMVFVPTSKIFHDYKYIPAENYQPLKQKLYYNERNRLITVLKNYNLGTLFILLPPMLFVEIGLVLFSLYQGWFDAKIKSYWSVCQLLPYILKQRKFIQSMRTVKDTEIIKDFEDKITFEKFNNIFVRNLVNPILTIYWFFVKKFI